VVFGALVFKLSVCCGAEGYVSGLWAAAHNPHINDDALSKSLQISSCFFVLPSVSSHVTNRNPLEGFS
jgi:hypothetical protein